MTGNLRPADQFHIGIVAEDFDATKKQLSEHFGFDWSEDMGGPVDVRLADGESAVDFRCAYARSSGAGTRLEIVRKVPGTFWEPTDGSGIHHLGYWSDDVAADVAALERHGYVTEATRKGPDGALFFAFLRSAGETGFRVELVSRAAQPAMERAWAR
ncbi:VOC family protein [Streptomyces sp. NPDC048291]|uniref:VOC family protein n=1 Tax=Streptomyces sp. NPDC048291 TaxID=3365530 RepID=UPI00371B2667